MAELTIGFPMMARGQVRDLHLIDRPLKRVPDGTALNQEDLLAVIKVTQFMRRVRDQAVSSCADGDAMWEILLYVIEQDIKGRSVSVTAACHATTIPQTTAMRKIDEMIAADLFERKPDSTDRRRILLAPTQMAYAQLNDYAFDAVAYMKAMFGLKSVVDPKDRHVGIFEEAAE